MITFKDMLKESAVGLVGRTGAADAKAHVGEALRAEFKKIVKKIGGKTVARQLLAEMNAGGPIVESDSQDEFQTWLASYAKKNKVDMKSLSGDEMSKFLLKVSKAWSKEND